MHLFTFPSDGDEDEDEDEDKAGPPGEYEENDEDDEASDLGEGEEEEEEEEVGLSYLMKEEIQVIIPYCSFAKHLTLLTWLRILKPCQFVPKSSTGFLLL